MTGETLGSASAAMSGTPRPPLGRYSLPAAAALATEVQLPGVSNSLMPPPPPIQESSSSYWPLLVARSEVPPTPVVQVPSAGQLTPGTPPGTPVEATSGQAKPLSPEEA